MKIQNNVMQKQNNTPGFNGVVKITDRRIVGDLKETSQELYKKVRQIAIDESADRTFGPNVLFMEMTPSHDLPVLEKLKELGIGYLYNNIDLPSLYNEEGRTGLHQLETLF